MGPCEIDGLRARTRASSKRIFGALLMTYWNFFETAVAVTCSINFRTYLQTITFIIDNFFAMTYIFSSMITRTGYACLSNTQWYTTSVSNLKNYHKLCKQIKPTCFQYEWKVHNIYIHMYILVYVSIFHSYYLFINFFSQNILDMLVMPTRISRKIFTTSFKCTKSFSYQ